MATQPARIAYLRLATGDRTVDREFQKVQRAIIGMFAPRVVTKLLSVDIQASDWLLLVDASVAPVAVVFPDAARLDGLHVTIIKTDNSVNAVTLQGTFSGVVNPTLATQYRSYTIDAGNGVYYTTASA